MNSDFKELLQILHERSVEYMIAGGYAVIHHAQPRYTKDIDIWLNPSEENAARLMLVFREFGIPLIDIEQSHFAVKKTQFSIGLPPCQLDFLTSIPGLEFEDAWKEHVSCDANGFPIHYLGKADLIRSKEVAGRLQDLADIEELKRT